MCHFGRISLTALRNPVSTFKRSKKKSAHYGTKTFSSYHYSAWDIKPIEGDNLVLTMQYLLLILNYLKNSYIFRKSKRFRIPYNIVLKLLSFVIMFGYLNYSSYVNLNKLLLFTIRKGLQPFIVETVYCGFHLQVPVFQEQNNCYTNELLVPIPELKMEEYWLKLLLVKLT